MTKNNECKMNAEAYGSQCRLDTSVKPEYDKRGEYGRSMTEMLGTLAIIGVLSIGGIAGYSYGMDKYRANETINDVNLRGIDLIRQVSMGQSLSLSEWSKKSKAGYDISEPVLSAEGDAYFTISGMPKRVCEMIYQAIQNNPTTKIEINKATNGDASDCNKDENNTMGFFFNQNSKISAPSDPTEPSPTPHCSEIASIQSSNNPGCPAAHCDDTGLKVIFYADWMSCRALECNWHAVFEGWYCME